MQVNPDMPRYETKKIVSAVKIRSLHELNDGLVTITSYDRRLGVMSTVDGWFTRDIQLMTLATGDLGYYILHKDGHADWSPSEAFEAEFTLVIPQPNEIAGATS